MGTGYLRQLKSGHIYAWTPALASRGDMVAYDDTTALARIEALKNEVQRKRDILEGLGTNSVEASKRDTDVAALLDKLEKTSESLSDTIRDKTSKPTGQEDDESDALFESSDTEEEAQLKQKKQAINEDPEVQLVRGLTNKNQVIEHVLRLYGTEMDRAQTLSTLKKQAVEMRTERLSESIMK